MKKFITTALAILALGSAAFTGAQAASFTLPINGGASLENNSFASGPVAKFSYGNIYDYTFSTTTNQVLSISLAAFRFEATGVPEAPANGVVKPVVFSLYNGNPAGAYTLMATSTSSLNSLVTFSAAAGQSYFIEIINNNVAPNSYLSPLLAGYK